MTMFVFLVVGYLLLLLGLTVYVSRGETTEAYLIAGRDRPWWQVMASKYAGSVGAGWFITYTGFAYQFGLPLLYIILGAIAGIVVYSAWAVPRVRRLGVRAYTQSDLVLGATGSRIAQRAIDGSVGLIAIFSLLISFTGAATLLEVHGLMSYEWAVLTTAVVVIGYIVAAGYRAVMLTDIVQGLLILVLTGTVVGYLVLTAPPSLAVLCETRDITLLGTLIFTVFGFVSIFADPTRYQVSLAGKSETGVARGLLATVPLMLLTIGAIHLIANVVYTSNPTLDPAAVFPVALTEFLPATLVPVGFFLFLVALMSTADSYLYALATHAVSLCTGRAPTKRSVQRWIIGFGGILTVIALLYRDVIGLSVLTGAGLLITAFPMLYVLAGGRSGLRLVLLLAGGYLGSFVGILVLGLIPEAGAFTLLGLLLGRCVPARWFQRGVL